jgi:hypothetical protein
MIDVLLAELQQRQTQTFYEYANFWLLRFSAANPCEPAR